MSDELIASGDPAEIEELRAVVNGLRSVIAGAPAEDPERALCLHDLGYLLSVLACRTGDIGMLRESILVDRDALAAAGDLPEDHRMHLSARINHRYALALLFECTDDTGDLTELTRADRAMIAAVASDNPNRAELLCLSWSDLAQLAGRVDETELVNEVAEIARQAVAALALDDPDRPAALADLVDTLLAVFERSGDADLLAEAVRIGRDGVRPLPGDDPVHSLFPGLTWHAIEPAEQCRI
ncbi:hypothetical protein [Nocardia alni]|uniref:hypothetical protein n=1 Tax=Nocardia alni TaxID=2815723 RepID=UPI001C245774|nr:hypothetical protein [Nocardia alni]